MNIEEFRDVLNERIACDSEYTFGIEECWKKEIKLLSEDPISTIEYLKNDCTADEYSWISEIFEDVIEIIPNKELVNVYKSLMTKFPEECSKYNIALSIENAELTLKWYEEHENNERKIS